MKKNMSFKRLEEKVESEIDLKEHKIFIGIGITCLTIPLIEKEGSVPMIYFVPYLTLGLTALSLVYDLYSDFKKNNKNNYDK